MTDLTSRLKDTLAQTTGEAHDLAERLETELEFAQNLCELHPDKATAWRKLLAQAADVVAAGAGSLADFRRAVDQAEELLAPLGKAAKGYTMYLVGHAHIDMNWMWSWPETVAVTNDTFTTVLKLMDEFPTFRFSQSQASVYRVMEEHNPELLAQIANRVREGRWEVTASHWVEGDKNLAGGESLCRHLLYTRRYMQELFGLTPEDVPIDWAPDTFGHAHAVPTYLVRGGVKYVYMHRPGTFGQPCPEAFRWRAPDGSTVLVRNDMRRGYNGAIGPDLIQHLMVFVRETGLPFFMYVYGVGDHGGGPTRRDLARAVELDAWPIYPNVVLSTAKAFYERLDQEGQSLPLIDRELNLEFTGCFTTQTLVKKANRYGEKKLADAEAFCALAWAAGARDYPAAAFEQGWRDTLFSHFHDILPGSGVHDTRTYTHGLYQQTVAMTGVTEANALRALAAKVDTSGDGAGAAELPPARVSRTLGAGVGFGSANGGMSASEQSAGAGRHPFVVFNPTAWERTEVVEAVVWDAGQRGYQPANAGQLAYAVEAPDGRLVGAQFLEHGHYWGHEFVRLAFPAEVSAFGYGVYTLLENTTAPADSGTKQSGLVHHCGYSQYERSPEGMENEFLRLELDPATGGIRRLEDKRSDLAVVAPECPASPVEYALERVHGMTAWLVDHTGPVEAPRVTAIRRKLGGPHKATLEVDLAIHESTFTLTYELRAGDPKLYLHLRGTWFERGTPQTGVPALRLALPFALSDAKARYEIPFGAIDRDMPHGEEVPALRWAQVAGTCSEQQAGCVLYNDSKHGHSLVGNTLRLTLIRSSYDPDPLPEIGQHEVHFALQPFAGELPVADAIRTAMAFEQELRVVSTDAHEGALPPAAQLVQAAPAGVVLSALKKAEDGDAFILRFFDPIGRKSTAKATLDEAFFGEVTQVEEVDLLERPVAKSTAKKSGNTVSVSVPRRGIASVKVALRR